ncbi:MAG: gliding motility protein RemB [Bacteroidota bacterium]
MRQANQKACLFRNDILVKYVIFTFSLMLTCSGKAQLTSIPLNHAFKDYFAQPLANRSHSAIQPFNPFEARATVDSIQQTYTINNQFTQTWLGRKLLNENMANVKGKDFQFMFNPLFDLSLGREDGSDELLFHNTRGLQVGAVLGEKFMIYSDFYENLHRFPTYIDQFIENNRVVPGQGIPKRDKQTEDFAYVNGYFDFQASKFLNLRFGYGKHFFGDGYRSLLLSDNSFNYPYLRMMTSFWKIKYVNLFTQMNDINILTPNNIFGRKYVTSHYLSAEVTPRLNLSLFESIVYQDTSGTRGYDINYLNPFILYRPIEFAVGSRGGNALVGGALKYQATNNMYIYAQGILDELLFENLFGGEGWWANKFGIQLGFKSYNTFIEGLMIQCEFNTTRPYTYTHRTASQNYAHYNEALAHPFGANFVESVNIVRYMKNRYFVEGHFIFSVQGRDFEDSNWGSDLYISSDEREQNFGNEFLQGNRTNLFFSNLKAGYIVNPNTNWRLEFSYTYRSLMPEVETTTLKADKTHYFQFGILTAINNHYYDF